MIVLSHRGDHRNEPENTLQAFEKAVTSGVDGIETDVRLSSDGLPILFHDRVAPNGREVAYVSRAELSEVVGYPVPTLDEALERFDSVLWNIEIKTPLAVDASKSIIREFSSSRHLLVTSFWHDIVEYFGQSAEVECGILVAHHPLSELSIQNLLPRHINTIVWDYEVLDHALLQSTKKYSLRNFVYGTRTRDEHQHCAELGLDGIITDHPEFII